MAGARVVGQALDLERDLPAPAAAKAVSAHRPVQRVLVPRRAAGFGQIILLRVEITRQESGRIIQLQHPDRVFLTRPLQMRPPQAA